MSTVAYATPRLWVNNVTVHTASGNVAMVNEGVVVVNKTSGAATTVTLTPSPSAGMFAFVIDGKGDAATNNVTVQAATGNINGAATHVISENYGSALFAYNGTQWNLAANYGALSATELAFLNGVTAGTAAASKALVLDANSELDGIGVIQKADKLLTTEEVLALNATPITVVPAPGAGVYLEFLGAYVFLDYNSAAYAADAGEDFCLRYTDATGDIVSTSIDGEEFEATADALFILSPVPTAPNVVTHPANAPLVAHLLSGEWATGDSPLKIRCYYREVRAAALAAIA